MSLELLGQARPADTNNAVLIAGELNWENVIYELVICNTTGADELARVFHSKGGATYSQATALLYDKLVPRNDLLQIRFRALGVIDKDNFAIRTSTASALTFTAYGIRQKRTEKHP